MRTLAIAIGLLGTLATTSAVPGVVYQFEGECGLGCTGIATAQVVMRDSYVVGDPVICDSPVLTNCNVAQFRYVDSAESLFNPNTPFPSTRVPMPGFILPTAPAPAEFYMNPLNFFVAEGEFITHLDGSWSMRFEVSLA